MFMNSNEPINRVQNTNSPMQDGIIAGSISAGAVFGIDALSKKSHTNAINKNQNNFNLLNKKKEDIQLQRESLLRNTEIGTNTDRAKAKLKEYDERVVNKTTKKENVLNARKENLESSRFHNKTLLQASGKRSAMVGVGIGLTASILSGISSD